MTVTHPTREMNIVEAGTGERAWVDATVPTQVDG